MDLSLGLCIPSTVEPDYPFVFYNKENTSIENYFTVDECQSIIDIYENSSANLASTDGGMNNNYRKVSKVNIETSQFETLFIQEKISSALYYCNKDYYGFNLSGLVEPFEILKYEGIKKSFYKKHIDWSRMQIYERKLSIVVQLSDPSSYTGGDTNIYIGDPVQTLEKKQGTINIFPSFFLHEVTPVLTGTRYALVSWVSGPPWR